MRRPWVAIEEESQAKALLQTLRPDPSLAAQALRAVARDGGTDEVLLALEDGSLRFALVHLTWDSRQQPLPWPSFQIDVLERLLPAARR